MAIFLSKQEVSLGTEINKPRRNSTTENSSAFFCTGQFLHICIANLLGKVYHNTLDDLISCRYLCGHFCCTKTQCFKCIQKCLNFEFSHQKYLFLTTFLTFLSDDFSSHTKLFQTHFLENLTFL